jgi:lipopolysaccharide/colanic/teichoic acid biosynthesis glycosyltransferase
VFAAELLKLMKEPLRHRRTIPRKDDKTLVVIARSSLDQVVVSFQICSTMDRFHIERRGSLRTEELGQKSSVFADASFHFALESAATGEDGAHTYLACGELCSEPHRTDSASPGSRLLSRGDGRRMTNPFWRGLSPWTGSAAKRVFDCACVLLSWPVLVPLLLAIGAAVRLTSQGPVLFLQKRAGMNGRTFTILKFRTMVHVSGETDQCVTNLHKQRFTPIGSFLRRWKLDELPQFANVLMGHMSLVGPRPKLAEFTLCELPCRPGLTGVATIAFAQEAAILARIPQEQLDGFYRDVVLPAKREMDAEYLAQATLLSDLGLLIETALRRWTPRAAEAFIGAAAVEFARRNLQPRTLDPASTFVRMSMPIPAMASHVASVEQAAAV